MKALVKNELRQTKGMLAIWLSLELMLIAFAYFEYLSLEGSLEELTHAAALFPDFLKIMFGVGDNIASPIGWYSCIYYWTGLLAFPYAAYLGSSCMTKELKQGTSEYLFTKPVCRRDIVLSKVIAGIFNMLVFSAFCGVCNYFMSILPLGELGQTDVPFSTTAGMFLTQSTLFALSFAVSGITRTYKSAIRYSALFVLFSYVLYMIAAYTKIGMLRFLTPLQFFEVGSVISNGLQIPFLLLSIAIITISILIGNRAWKTKEL